MYTSQTIFSMIIFILVGTVLSFGLFTVINTKFRISGFKIMLLGIGFIAFSNTVLKGMTQGDIDVTISIIGSCFILSGFIIKDN